MPSGRRAWLWEWPVRAGDAVPGGLRAVVRDVCLYGVSYPTPV